MPVPPHPDPSPATATAPPNAGGIRNHLLRSLPPAELDRLLPLLERVEVAPMEVIAERGAVLPYVHFPETAIISLLSQLSDGTLVENGTVGYEGVAALPLLLGTEWTPALITGQVPGASLRIEAAAFRALLPELPTFDVLARRYALYFLTQVSQSLACNSRHRVEQRCARWLLMSHDRVPGDQFVLTHEVLAQMLAVRRTGVTVAAGALQDAGYIRYRRGRITVVDRPGLEGAACECYAVVREQRDRLLGTLGE